MGDLITENVTGLTVMVLRWDHDRGKSSPKIQFLKETKGLLTNSASLE